MLVQEAVVDYFNVYAFKQVINNITYFMLLSNATAFLLCISYAEPEPEH
jgi:hypothetical protein